MSALSERIKSFSDIEKEVVFVKQWNEEIEIRTMSAKQRSIILNKKSIMDEDGNIINDKFQALMIIASCYVPGTDELVFSKDDAEWLMDKSAGAIEFVGQKVMKLSGLTSNAVESAEQD